MVLKTFGIFLFGPCSVSLSGRKTINLSDWIMGEIIVKFSRKFYELKFYEIKMRLLIPDRVGVATYQGLCSSRFHVST